MTADLDLIRRAANQMLELAEAATSGPWAVAQSGYLDHWATVVRVHDEPAKALPLLAVDLIGGRRSKKLLEEGKGFHAVLSHGDAEHIAHWDPVTTLAVADLLTCHADGIERTWSQHATDAWPEPYRRSLAVARAFLKEDQ
ncbi:hypothetical protein F9L07_19545 [Pimelobacter simplex]|uniref:Uncharacterized protein n=1 Tax=Nocardioides simplex TaxID=2045 RepID=A0A7J5DV94_NOCSI|nr:hypothetical protein [Pimelobacter simplex]KAB2809237.1 hypothetical protein F9L07_19545 [Pimelobacter simplex]